jgi:hypothetical protein
VDSAAAHSEKLQLDSKFPRRPPSKRWNAWHLRITCLAMEGHADFQLCARILRCGNPSGAHAHEESSDHTLPEDCKNIATPVSATGWASLLKSVHEKRKLIPVRGDGRQGVVERLYKRSVPMKA